MLGPLTIATWSWGSKYSGHYVERLKAGVARHLKQEYRFAVFSPEPQDAYLTKVPGCFARLRLFDPAFQAKHNLSGRIVNIDLDAVVTGSLDELFDRPESFVILHGGNSSNPCPYQGSLWMLRAGEHANVWRDFSLKRADEVPFFSFPDDQAWFADRLPKAAGWEVGSKSGVYCFQKPGWPASEALPEGARLVAFPGWRDPGRFAHIDWVKNNWR